MRLLEDVPCRLVVRSVYDPDNILWSRDLIGLLEQTCPSGIASLQEYLDRQDEWTLFFNYKGDAFSGTFVALSVTINGWTIWFQGSDL